MVYFSGVTSPALTEFFRALGATEIHFGLLAGIPLVMLFMQFVGAVVNNRIRHRKYLYVGLGASGRVLHVPLVPGSVSLPGLGRAENAHGHVRPPGHRQGHYEPGDTHGLFLVGRSIPHRILSSYRGFRQRVMSFIWAGAYVLLAWILRTSDLPITVLYPRVAFVAVAAGIVDLALFLGIHEPPNTIVRGRPVWEILADPFRHPQYGFFVFFSCVWLASTMFGAAFMLVYTLKVLELPVWLATVVFCMSGAGSALSSHRWGRLADRHGSTPVMRLCLILKPAIAVAFLLVTPRSALWVLIPMLLFDGMLNGGFTVSQSGYMMKIAPQQNRSMFIAAITGLAGLCGALAAMGGGAFLEATHGFGAHFFGRDWNNYHLLFLISFFARVRGRAFLVRRVPEPKRSPSIIVMNDYFGVWPARLIRFPVGLYRLWSTAGSDLTRG